MRSVSTIAYEVIKAWQGNPKKSPYQIYAFPYLEAMTRMTRVTDKYGYEDGEMIVLRFLNAATYWRGEQARAIKAELNNLLSNAGTR